MDESDYKELLSKVSIFMSSQDLANPQIWNDPKQAGILNKTLVALKQKKQKFEDLVSNCKNLLAAIELSDGIEQKLVYNQLNQDFVNLQNEQYLSGKFDHQDAQLSLHSGAGGLDAQDWTAMLCAMYQSFATNQGWDWEIISLSAGEEGGTKSVTLNIKGQNVYGYLKEEAGVHRLVRISPFNAGKTRETSFALLEILPLEVNDFVQIQEILEKDLKWEYSTSSGKGGQSVNTTYSAVRLVHLPTGISVTCQNERSQTQNKQQALKYLKNKLAVLEIKKNQELKNEIKGDFISAEWGSQIRSYVLHPYKMVKDHRSGFESGNITDILENGNILPIIWSVKAKML
jgi:peptide chain release factor 2